MSFLVKASAAVGTFGVLAILSPFALKGIFGVTSSVHDASNIIGASGKPVATETVKPRGSDCSGANAGMSGYNDGCKLTRGKGNSAYAPTR